VETRLDDREGEMKQIPLLLIGAAVLGLAFGFLAWFVRGAFYELIGQYWFLDYTFYWRGAMALLTAAIVVVLIQIRDK
jgi:hypothetical protein